MKQVQTLNKNAIAHRGIQVPGPLQRIWGCDKVNNELQPK